MSAEEGANALRKAMKGFGTDEKALTEVLGAKTTNELVEIKEAYTNVIGRDLMKDLKDECGGDFEETCLALCTSSAEYDAQLVMGACKGLGTSEKVLVEIFCTRTGTEIKACIDAFKTLYQKDMIAVVEDEVSDNLQKLFVCLCQHDRAENPENDLDADVQVLFDAGENKFGTNEGVFIRMLGENSRAYCEKLYFAYAEKHGKALDKVITDEMGGPLGLALAGLVTPLEIFFANSLLKSMKGIGTDDSALIRIIVSQRERALKAASTRFLADNKVTLGTMVESECGGDYKKLLVAIIENFARAGN